MSEYDLYVARTIFAIDATRVAIEAGPAGGRYLPDDDEPITGEVSRYRELLGGRILVRTGKVTFPLDAP